MPVVDEQQQGLRLGQPGEQRAEGVGRVRRRLAGQRLQHVAKGLQRFSAEMTVAITPQNSATALHGAAQEVFDQPRLAHAGRPGNGHQARAPGHGVVQGPLQATQFGLAPNEGRGRPAELGGKALGQAGAGVDAVHQQRCRAALHAQQLRWAGDEETAGRPERLVADQNLVRPRGVGQA